MMSLSSSIAALALAFLVPIPAALAADLVAGVKAEVKEAYSLERSTANPGDQPAKVSDAAGRIWRLASGEKLVSLRALDSTLPPRSSASISTPVAALSTAFRWKLGDMAEPTAVEDRALEPLLKYLSTRNDVPRQTSQIVIFALLEDITFAGWQKYVAANAAVHSEAAPAMQTELAGALDALAILQAIAPERKFALAGDAELKLRSLRDPALRPKALQLFGLVIPGDAPAGGLAPDLGQLLHTKVGDNCPICRLRQPQDSRAGVP
jgi:hypothetical protein